MKEGKDVRLLEAPETFEGEEESLACWRFLRSRWRCWRTTGVMDGGLATVLAAEFWSILQELHIRWGKGGVGFGVEVDGVFPEDVTEWWELMTHQTILIKG